MSKNIRELPLAEQLYIEQALYSRLGADVSSKDADSLRSQVDETIIGTYEATGAKSYDARINGEKVGSYSVRVSKGKPEQQESYIAIDDYDEFAKFVESHPIDVMDFIKRRHAEDFAMYMLSEYGEVVDGAALKQRVTPAQPPRILGTTLRIDAEKVGQALSGYLPATFAGLLEGEQDGE